MDIGEPRTGRWGDRNRNGHREAQGGRRDLHLERPLLYPGGGLFLLLGIPHRIPGRSDGSCDRSGGETVHRGKGIAGGYASLDSSGLVPAAQLQVALTETRGITRYATSTETATGTETSAAVTPYALTQSGLIPGAATTTTAGTMSAADKTKLDGLPAPAASDSGKFLRAKEDCTGYELESPVGDLDMIIALGGE